MITKSLCYKVFLSSMSLMEIVGSFSVQGWNFYFNSPRFFSEMALNYTAGGKVRTILETLKNSFLHNVEHLPRPWRLKLPLETWPNLHDFIPHMCVRACAKNPRELPKRERKNGSSGGFHRHFARPEANWPESRVAFPSSGSTALWPTRTWAWLSTNGNASRCTRRTGLDRFPTMFLAFLPSLFPSFGLILPDSTR